MPRPRKPLEQKVLDGSYRPCKDGVLPEELEKWRSGDGPPPEPPPKPEGLSDAASAMWDQVMSSRPGTIWPSDSFMLSVYCEWCGLWKLALAAAQAAPTSEKLTPLGIITDKLDKLGAKFGLNPKDRAALPVVSDGPRKAKVATRQPTKLDKKGPPK